MRLPSDPIVVTGANGQIGRALLGVLAASGHRQVRALVRSERARDTIEAQGLDPAPEIRIVDYASPKEMEQAIHGFASVAHLVGIIKETRSTRYVEAHEQTCHALALAATRASVGRIVYLSILGAAPDAENDCLASKGRAETLLLDDRVATTVLRVPMVLGGDDFASASLRRQARARRLFLVAGGRTLQQPIDVRDLVAAVLSACSAGPGKDLALDAGGPESLSHRQLVQRAARLWRGRGEDGPRIHGIPIGLARFGVDCLERVLRDPPITRAMFEILQHDDRVDPEPFCRALELSLRPLDETLRDHVGPDSEPASDAGPADASARADASPPADAST